MSLYTEIKNIVKGEVENIVYSFQAKIKSIDGNTCTVEIMDSEDKVINTISGVKLQATTTNTENSFISIPKKESFVLIGSLNGSLTDLAVLNADELESIRWKQNELEIKISAEGLEINNQSQNLSKVLNDLITEVQKIIVIIGTSPNVAALELIKQRLNKILI